MTSRKFTVGVIGAGSIANTAHLPALSTLPDVRIAWIHDRDARRTRAVADAWGIVPAVTAQGASALPAADVVLLALPLPARKTFLQEMASRSTAVLCEKPFAADATEQAWLLSAFPPTLIGCGLQRRTYASINLVREVIASGIFGALQRVTHCEGARTTKTGGSGQFLAAGGSRLLGVVYDLGIHGLDGILYATGARGHSDVKVKAIMDGPVMRKAQGTAQIASKAGDFLLEFDVSWLDPQPNETRWEFEKALLSCGTSPNATVWVSARGHRFVLGPRAAEFATSATQAFHLEWRWFLDGIVNERESAMAGASVMATTELVDAICQAGEAGGP